MNKRPKCQDGRVCEGINDGFMFYPFITSEGKRVNKFICGDCYMIALKEAKEKQ